MKHRRLVFAAIAVLCISVAVIVSVKLFAKEPEPEFVFTYAENQSDGYPTSMGAYRFAELVKERSGGRIRIIVYTSAKLGREAEVIEQMQYGGVDFTRVSLSQLAEFFPEMNVLQMPYLYDDADHMWSVLEGEIGDYFLDAIKSIDLCGLSWYESGARNFYTSTRPVNKLSDLKGLKIRVQQSDLMVDMVNALGAEAVPLSYEEVYSALELGTIDGAENNWPSYEDTDHYKVAKYFCEDEHTRVPEMQLCSLHTWNLLSEADKQMIRECALESSQYEREMWKERVESSRETALSNGVVVTTLTQRDTERIRALMQPIYEKYCGDNMDILEKIRKK